MSLLFLLHARVLFSFLAIIVVEVCFVIPFKRVREEFVPQDNKTMSRFEEYMRDGYLGLGDISASPQSVTSRPPLYPQGSERRSTARTPPATPPTQPLQPVPSGRSGGYQQPVQHPPPQSYAPVFQAAPVQQQQPVPGPSPSVPSDTMQLLLRSQEQSIMDLESTVGNLSNENRELQTELKSAESLTAEASNLLHSVQADLDAVHTEANKMMQKLLPENHQAESQATIDIIRHTAQHCVKMLQSTLDGGAELEIENQTLREGEKQLRKEVILLQEGNISSGNNIVSEQRVAKLERELDGSISRNNDLLQKITELQTELMESRSEGTPISNSQTAKMKAVYDVSAAEFQDKIQHLQAELRRSEVLRTDLEKQLGSQEKLLRTTESALKKERSLLQQQEVNREVEVDFKEGYLLKLVDETWHRRWVAASLQCLQNFSSELDADSGHSRKGCRWYAMQAAFISRFTSNLAESTDPLTGVSCYHPLAVDPNCYYFGFLPKPENDSTPYLLTTESREVWLSWSKFLSRQFGSISSNTPDRVTVMRENNITSPEILTPPSRQNVSLDMLQSIKVDLSTELTKSKKALQDSMQQQEYMREKVSLLEDEKSGLAKTVKDMAQSAKENAKITEEYRSKGIISSDEAAASRNTIKVLTEAIEVSKSEISNLRTQLDKKRAFELSIVENTSKAESDNKTKPVLVNNHTCTSPEKKPVTATTATDDLSLINDQLNFKETELRSKLSAMAAEREEASTLLKEQEAHHTAQIEAFCDQVLDHLDAVKTQSKVEIAKRDEDWQRELAIWQQLVAEKEQQLAMSGYNKSGRGDTGEEDSLWKVIGNNTSGTSAPTATPTLLSLKLTGNAAGGMSGLGDFDIPKTYGTRIAVDKRRLTQLSVTDDPSTREGMSRSWKFKTAGGADYTTVVLSLAILPNGIPPKPSSHHIHSHSRNSMPSFRSHSATRQSPRRASVSSRSRLAGRHGVFVP